MTSLTSYPFHWPLLVLALQAACMGADELLFHRRRPLTRWERVGHPLDTLTVLLPLALALLLPPQAPWTGLFVAGAIFSCLFVTKDEWVHARACGGGENWLHALLFMLHPLLFLALFALWKAGEGGWLLAQAALTAAFLAYQALYWNFVRAPDAGGAAAEAPVNNAFYDDLGDRWLHAQDDPVALLRAEGKAKQAWIEERLEAAFGSSRPLRILDVGCGAGFLARRLAALGHEVHALDYSRGSLLTSRRAEDSGDATPEASTRARYVQGDAYRLPFEEKTFDVVCSLDFLEHVEDPAATVAEAARVLRPGGLFFFHTFNRNLPAWLIVIKGLEWFVKNTPPHMHVLRLFIKPKELAGFCRAVGLEPEAWTGLRPDFKRAAFWKMLRTGSVPDDFVFERTPSLLLSYLGVAKKRGN